MNYVIIYYRYSLFCITPQHAESHFFTRWKELGWGGGSPPQAKFRGFVVFYARAAKISTTIDVDWDNVLPMPTEPFILHNKLATNITVITLFPGICSHQGTFTHTSIGKLWGKPSEHPRQLMGKYWGVFVSLLDHCYSKYYRKNSSKAPQDYPSALRASNLSICLWENPQIRHLHHFAIFGRVNDSQNQLLVVSLGTRTL